PLRESLNLGRGAFAKAININMQTIKNIESGLQRPTEDVLSNIAEQWPQFAYWLLTGMIDEKNGHINPEIERIRRDSEKGLEATG
ncbi:MAG: helix-turn-helix transcriptional regulator, partial [Magnetococcales bacterium]|nr:helix-turn-helix transcriptional regulator [Magnetococcales bacterium]